MVGFPSKGLNPGISAQLGNFFYHYTIQLPMRSIMPGLPEYMLDPTDTIFKILESWKGTTKPHSGVPLLPCKTTFFCEGVGLCKRHLCQTHSILPLGKWLCYQPFSSYCEYLMFLMLSPLLFSPGFFTFLISHLIWYIVCYFSLT